jgi:hypothetical protein
MKGIIKPTKLLFVPSKIALRRVSLLEKDQLFEVKSNSDDYLAFELNADQAESGYYDLIFEIKGRSGKRDFLLYSSIFPLHISDQNTDKVSLQTVGKFYDSPVASIFNIPQEKWNNLKNKAEGEITFLGPTIMDVIAGKTDTIWKIRCIKGNSGQNENESYIDIDKDSSSEVYLDLKIPIEERLFKREDVFEKFLGSDWQKTMDAVSKKGLNKNST